MVNLDIPNNEAVGYEMSGLTNLIVDIMLNPKAKQEHEAELQKTILGCY